MTMPAAVFDSLPANGWLTREEAELLWRAANTTEGAILEVGSYYGRSTCLLAALGRLVYAVDPFDHFDSDDPSGDKVSAAFQENLSARQISNVILYRQRIEDWEPKPAGFAYLDGDHTYWGTVAQIQKARLCNPSAIAIHDIAESGDGYEVKRAAEYELGPWTERAGVLAVWKLR